MENKKNRYLQIIESIFDKHYKRGAIANEQPRRKRRGIKTEEHCKSIRPKGRGIEPEEIEFTREDIVTAARRLKVALPKNLGDVLYSFRYRVELPYSITRRATAGHEWIIRPAGRSLYRFVLTPKGAANIMPSGVLTETKVLDSTPGVIAAYALSDEQALLAKLRYNRLIDTFTGLTCYSLQNHLRTTAPGMGQVETDEIYIGVDKRGVHFVLPVQGKGGRDKIGAVQIEQDMAVCAAKFPALVCRPIAAQFMADELSTQELLSYQGRPA